jgi:hypothetical protein
MEPEGSLPCSQKPANRSYTSQLSSVHIVIPYSFKIHFNTIFPSMVGSAKWHLPFTISDHKSVCFWNRAIRFLEKIRFQNYQICALCKLMQLQTALIFHPQKYGSGEEAAWQFWGRPLHHSERGSTAVLQIPDIWRINLCVYDSLNNFICDCA